MTEPKPPTPDLVTVDTFTFAVQPDSIVQVTEAAPPSAKITWTTGKHAAATRALMRAYANAERQLQVYRETIADMVTSNDAYRHRLGQSKTIVDTSTKSETPPAVAQEPESAQPPSRLDHGITLPKMIRLYGDAGWAVRTETGTVPGTYLLSVQHNMLRGTTTVVANHVPLVDALYVLAATHSVKISD